MNPTGDAAEQVVRMSLEGIEVAARITGRGAEHLGVRLYAVLKEEQKTKGKARLTSMLKSGKELKVFSIQQKDLKTFSQEAKRYGVLYCALKDKNGTPESSIDVIARAEDASKIQRITEKFKLVTIDTNTVMGSVEKERLFPERNSNPTVARTQKEDSLSVPDSKNLDPSNGLNRPEDRPSVREKLEAYRVMIEKKKGENTLDKGLDVSNAIPNGKAPDIKMPEVKVKER